MSVHPRSAALLAPCALAASTFASAQGGVRQVDADHSGGISRTEAASHPGLSQHFDAIDTNRDGLLTESELRAWRGTRPGNDHGAGHKADKLGFRDLDTNNDQAISRQEVAARPKLAEIFDQVDANHDGSVTKAEAKAYRATHAKDTQSPRP